MLWRISGFNSAVAPPSHGDAPISVEHQATRSAFGEGYERLLQFHTPDVDPFYMRFSLYQKRDQHAVLAMGNTASTIFFWDFQQLMAKSTSTDSHGAIPGQASLRRKSKSPGSTRHMSDPFTNIEAHESVVINDDDFRTRQIAWCANGEWMVAVGDEGMMAVFHR